MQDRAAVITGASRGIGFVLAKTLAEEGYQLTISARRPDRLEAAAEKLREDGHTVTAVAVNMADESAVRTVIDHHREAYGRLDVLVNNAGVGIGASAAEHQTKHIDLQLQLNLRAIVFSYREAAQLLRAAGAEHGSALVVNLASMAGKSGQPWLSVYSATKAAVISYTESMNKEFSEDGVKSVALCPAFVDTDMTEFVRGEIPRDKMIRPEDLGLALRFLLHVSPACVVPEIMFQQPGGGQFGA
ncbi:MAG TPA: SDR family oxidoreductase [Solirubrobacteraceae bacterium]|jgi:short-subunit dehydrogenase|nr:SDR family oxidoreductase [Solirubrobacteraceae bacterium]